MSVSRKCDLKRVTFALTCVVLIGQVRSQDVGSFLAGLLGASDVPKNDTAAQQNPVPPCPGECVHAFTSILCSKVIEQFNCGAGYLRCCVSSDFTFGTVVETSAPLPEEASTESSADYDVFLLTTTPNGGYATKQTLQALTPSQPPPTPQTSSTQAVMTTTRKPQPCRGICVENIFVRYCGSTISDGICDRGSTCCASSIEDDVPPPKISTTTTTTTTTPATTTTERNNYIRPQSNQFSGSGGSYVATTLPGPRCPGSCVAPLFSLLCDAVDDNYYCVNDGRCCVSNEEPLQVITTTTTQAPKLSIPCHGACIPMFLRGMCNRPSEVIPLTECDEDFVCCYQPDVKEHLHIEAPQIPLLRPGAPQQGYPGIHLPQNNAPPLRQPSVSHSYPQHPQIPLTSNPAQSVIMPHIQNQGNGNQVYLGNVRPGYPAVHQVHHPHAPPPHESPSVIQIPYQTNTNYGNPYQQQGFHPVSQKHNSSLDTHSVRLTVVTPPNQPGVVHSEEYYTKRRPNISQIMPQQSQPVQTSLYQPQNVENNPLRLIAPPSSVQGVVSQIQPDDVRKQQTTHDRFVETAIGFAPDTLRPGTIHIPHKPPPLEKFYPPSPRPSFRPTLRNTSTILVLHVDEEDDIEGALQEAGVKPEIIESTFKPMQDSFKPLLSQNNPAQSFNPSPSFNPAPNLNLAPGFNSAPSYNPVPSFNPVSISSPAPPRPTAPAPVPKPVASPPAPKPAAPALVPNPVASASVPKPVAPVAETKPVITIEETIAHPSNTNFYTVTAEQAKKMRPACPGSCIASFLRFTCFGNNAIYDGFACEGSGIMCCTSVEYIEKYEEHLKSGTPLTFIKPDFDSKGSQTSIDTTRRPGMYVCGIKGNQRRKTGRIMGGKTSLPGEWCWQVALINAKNQYLCGGALIGSRWVLTAAHCITALVRNGDAIYVRVGDFDLASQTGSPGAQTQKVSTSYIHHNHNGQTLDNDIALLKLENPVQLQESVCLVCLPARGAESTPGKRCTVTGYGYLGESGPIALKVREAELPIVEEKLCTEQINKVTEKRFILPAGSFCAGGEPENDACQGDGGGPLTCLNEGYYELTGLVSWGFGCGKQDVPGVYVKVSSYIGWINQIISVNN